MKNKIEIKKVKHNNSGVIIEYFTNDSIVLESAEEPMQSFREAFQSVKPHFMKLCEFEVSQKEGSVKLDNSLSYVIKGISFSCNKDGDESVIITATKHLKSGKTITINAPVHSFEDWENSLIDAVDNIKKEAINYIEGKRQYTQQTLFDDKFDKSASLEEEIEKDKFQTKLNTFDEKLQHLELPVEGLSPGTKVSITTSSPEVIKKLKKAIDKK